MLNELLIAALLVLTFIAGVLAGIMWYRYQLRTRPEKLQEWIDQAGDSLRHLQDSTKETLNLEADLVQKSKDQLVKELTDLLARLK